MIFIGNPIGDNEAGLKFNDTDIVVVQHKGVRVHESAVPSQPEVQCDSWGQFSTIVYLQGWNLQEHTAMRFGEDRIDNQSAHLHKYRPCWAPSSNSLQSI